MRPLTGIALKVASTVVFAVMVALIKSVGLAVPPGEAVFFRSFFALLPVLGVLWWRGETGAGLKTSRPFAHIVRSFFGVTAMILWFGGLQRLPLPDALAISYAAPLITVALAAIVLGEIVRYDRWIAVAVGFVGVLVTLSPHLELDHQFSGDSQSIGAMMSFTSALFMALAGIQIRRLTATEPTGAIVVYFSIGSALFALLTLPFGWVIPSPRDTLLLVLAGLLGGIGQLMLTQSYRYAPASTIAPLEYASMLWAMVIGNWFFNEMPGTRVLIGSMIVVGAGLAIVWRARA